MFKRVALVVILTAYIGALLVAAGCGGNKPPAASQVTAVPSPTVTVSALITFASALPGQTEFESIVPLDLTIDSESTKERFARLPEACEAAHLTNCATTMTSIKRFLAIATAQQSGEDARAEAAKKGLTPKIDAALDLALRRLHRTSTSSSVYPPLAYWTDSLAELRGSIEQYKWATDDGAWTVRSEQLQAQGVVYEGLPNLGVGALFDYEHRLLRDLAVHYQSTHWGKLAFIEMTERQWALGGSCGFGFVDVTEHGERYRDLHPHSDIDRWLEGKVAKAYETWWSVAVQSIAAEPNCEDCFIQPEDRRKYLPQADKARRRAIVLYSDLLEDESDAALAAEIRQAIATLKNRADTGARDRCHGVGV